jgi:hypothetical protein
VNIVNCSSCEQPWSLYDGTATPMMEELRPSVRVPVKDIYDQTTGHVWTGERSAWTATGPAVKTVETDGDGLVGETLWACGNHIATIPRPLFDKVPCLACRPGRKQDGPWWKEVVQSCTCCRNVGGHHRIPRVPGPDYTAPACGATVVTP